MSADLSTTQIRNWHRSNVLLFAFMGASWTALLTRMPVVKADLGVTASQLGLILLCTGIGSLVGLNIIGRLIAKSGTKRWIMILYPLLGLLVILNTVLIETHQVITYIALAFVMGAFMGMTDVSVNVDGTALEKATGKTLMPRMHAGFSVGTLVGSGWGVLTAGNNWDLFWTTFPLAAAAVVLPFAVAKYLPAAVGVETKTEAAEGEAKPAHWFTMSLIFLGLGILGVTLAEGGAGDWMTLGFTEGYHATPANAGIGFALFYVGMVVVRWYGGSFADRIGKGRALQLFAALGVIGLLLVILGAPNLIFGWIGALLWGAGVALGFPLFLSVAGEGENSAKRVGFVATWGYGAFLAGPPLLGLLADKLGMLNMYFVIAAFLVIALLVAGTAGKKRA